MPSLLKDHLVSCETLMNCAKSTRRCWLSTLGQTLISWRASWPSKILDFWLEAMEKEIPRWIEEAPIDLSLRHSTLSIPKCSKQIIQRSSSPLARCCQRSSNRTNLSSPQHLITVAPSPWRLQQRIFLKHQHIMHISICSLRTISNTYRPSEMACQAVLNANKISWKRGRSFNKSNNSPQNLDTDTAQWAAVK